METVYTYSFTREETFQREIMCGLLNAKETDLLLWNIERTVSKIYIPVLLASCMGDKGSKELLIKVKKELLPCLRSFTRYIPHNSIKRELRIKKNPYSSLRVAELVWKEGTLIKDYPPESYEMKNLEDVWEYLKTENAAQNFEGYIRGWMKQIQELLLESEQLRLETDDAGPQVGCLNRSLPEIN